MVLTNVKGILQPNMHLVVHTSSRTVVNDFKFSKADNFSNSI